MSRWQIIGVVTGAIAAVFSIIATIIGATWVLSERINEVRVEFHKEIGENRTEFHKAIGEVRVEIREENAETRDEFRKDIGDLRTEFRTDIRDIGTKMDGFIDSHRREHDIRYDSAEKDEENSTSAN